MQIGMAMRKPGGLTLPQRIRSLFSAGEQGAWYDPSDFSTLFQDSAGTTPVTAVEQPVGKILDKSGRGNHATQATSTKRPVLKQDANGKHYLKFDGVDDALATGSIDFTATDKITVFAGVRKLSDAATGVLAELSFSDGSQNGTFTFAAPSTTGENSYRFASKGTVTAVAGTGVFAAAPNTSVLTGIGSIADDVVTFRRNGTFIESGVTDQGTGNFGNYPLYIGSRAGTSLPFNGHLYSLIIRGAQSTDAQIAAAEAFCNQKTGAY